MDDYFEYHFRTLDRCKLFNLYDAILEFYYLLFFFHHYLYSCNLSQKEHLVQLIKDNTIVETTDLRDLPLEENFYMN